MISSAMVVGSSRFVSSTYEWEIDNYSLYHDMKNGECIKSPSFSTHKASWHIELYPNGDDESAQGYISLFLFLNKIDIQHDIDIKARYAFSLMNNNKKVIASNNTGIVRLFSTAENHGWGLGKFVKKSVVKDDTIITSLDKLNIICEVVVEEANAYKTKLTINPEQMQHFQGLKNLINNPKFSDVKFSVQDKEIFAHKLILASNSTVFAAMFEHNMRENEENIVKIEDISYNTFNALLCFIYTGDCILSDDIVSELFEAADKYQLLKLKDMCEEELCKIICVDNVITFLQLADMHNAENLKKQAIEFIALQGKEILDKPEFELIRNFNTELLKDVFRGFLNRIH